MGCIPLEGKSLWEHDRIISQMSFLFVFAGLDLK